MRRADAFGYACLGAFGALFALVLFFGASR